MAQQILLRRGTALQWTTANPILAQGEQGLETDTNLIKIGDGSTTWTLLSYTSAIGLLKANNLSDLANVVTARTNLGLGTLATQNGTFSGTSSGTNTGDNAVNSLYSGLVTNATHTGDATGSTALTVVAINGTSLSGLATGLLKNTTSTGVPSIAVQSDITSLLGAGSITNAMLVNGAVANLSGTNTGDQTITLTGAVTGIGTGSFVTTLASAIVGISNLSATGTPSSTTFLRGDNTWATPAGGGGGLSDGDKGDITVSSSGSVWTLDNSVVTLAKMADMATASLIGRNTGGTGVPEVLSASTTKTLLSLNNVENTALSTWAGTGNITTLGTITTGTWSGTTIAVNKGGTNLTSYAVGDLIYASASTTLSKLAAVATGNVLISGGFITAPSWGKVGLTTHVSGTLPVAYGGTGITSAGGIGSLLVGSGTTSFNTVAGNTTTTKKYLTQTGDGVDSDDPVWESLETAGISWITYSDTITWNGTDPSGATTHEYRYYQIGKMVFGFIRLEYATAGISNTTLTLATNSFPVISKPSNAANGENMIACTGYIDSSNTGSPPATRCWMEASANTSGFVVKFVAASQSAKFAMCSFTYLTA